MTARFLTVAATFVVVLAGIGCGQGSGSQKPNNRLALASPNPVTVTEHLDPGHSTPAIIDSTGGTLTVTGADAVTYTLTIPANAMPSSTQIRMTPVAGLDGMPWQGGLLAAVHIEPDRLQLLRPAVLVADGVRPAPAGTNPAGFMYEGTGIDFRLYPLDASQRTHFQFHLLHFSSPGVGGASQQDITNQSQHPPCTPQQQLEDDLARPLLPFRLGQLTGEIPQDAPIPPDLIAQLQHVLDAFRNNVVAPEIDKAVTSGATIEDFKQAYSDLDFWKRQADLRGLKAELYGALHARLFQAAAVKRAFREGVNRCFMHDVVAGIIAWQLLRDVTLTESGIDLPLDPIDRCLRFKLEFHTQLSIASPVHGARMEASATVQPLSMTAGGSAPLMYLNFTFTPFESSRCTFSGSPQVVEEFRVLQLIPTLKREEDSQSWPGKSRPKFLFDDIALDMTPGKAHEVITASCPTPLGTVTGGGPCLDCYDHSWLGLHRNELVGDFYRIQGWTIQNGQHLVARKLYNRSIDFNGATIGETPTELKLWHEPVGNGMP